MSKFSSKGTLLVTTVLAGMAFSAPAYAQDATNQATPPGTLPPQQTSPNEATTAPTPGTPASQAPQQNTNTPPANPQQEIIVTGSLLRTTTTETPSPVTVLSAQTLAQRGINTVSEATQRLSANNAGTITAGWNTGFNFASGANAPSLRGLTVQDTVSLFDGLRMAVYPLADDGQRNFVDLNTIPTGVIDRIEVLRDGASSTYGADAIAGVVNIITKKQVRGLHVNGSYGISQRGDAGEKHVDATWGYGDLTNQGFNVYVSGEYQKNNALWARDRGFPFNTQDLSSICNSDNSCMSNLNWNGVSQSGAYNGNISVPGVTWVRPESAPGSATGAGQFQFLNPGAGCRGFDEVHPTGVASVPVLNGVQTSCEVNFQHDYIMLQPQIKRRGLTARATFHPAEGHEVYIEGNAYWTDTFASFTPLGFNGTPTPPIPATLGAYNVMLPVYVCPTGVGTRTGTGTGCDATNGVLNPYNPFAANGQTAQAFVRSTRPRTVTTNARALRVAAGASGTFLDGFNYNVEFTASDVRLKVKQKGYLIPQRIATAVARGEINFNDLEATPDNIWDYISPTNRTTSDSSLWMANGTISRNLFALPGGDLGLAVGAAYIHESLTNPSANPPILDEFGNPDPTANQYDRYYSINAVGAQGRRNVKSAYFELNAPFFDIRQNGFGAEVNVSGRYDKYSTGQHSFSPKVGVKVTPVKEIALRGTWSKGFRIPSFNEAFGTPTTGYVSRTLDCTNATFAAFCAAHGNNTYASNAFPLGLTQTGNPALEPEKSTNLTAGVIFQPIRPLSLTVDFWKIKIKNLIIGSSPEQQAAAFTQYYSNNGVVNVPGVTVLPGTPDPAFPNALPQIGFIAAPFQNADSETVQGVDFGANARFNFGGIRWTSNLEASYLQKFAVRSGGVTTRYDGSLSPCNITSCSGAPKWRGNWQNTFDFGNTTLSATVYYTSGYGNESTDFGATRGDCQSGLAFGSVIAYEDGTPVRCRAKPVWNVDFTAAQKINDSLTIYANVLNVLDIDAPFDPSAAYGLFNYNPAWAQPNIIGRYFRIGAKLDLNPAPYVAPAAEYVAPPPPPPPAAPATQTCPDGSVILATDVCPAPPPPPPPVVNGERGQ
ncbi:iron complex outermembrane recepter protein [Sphingomonas sp. F9_3S_D5_B_2]